MYRVLIKSNLDSDQAVGRMRLSGWTSNRSSESAAFNISSREKPIFRTSSIVTLAGQTKDTQMPVSTVRRGTRGERSGRLDQSVTASGVPECDLVR